MDLLKLAIPLALCCGGAVILLTIVARAIDQRLRTLKAIEKPAAAKQMTDGADSGEALPDQSP